MNTDHRVNAVVLFGQLDCATAARNGGPNRDDARHAGVMRALQHLLEVGCEIRIIEVRVSFDKHEAKLAQAPRSAIPKCGRDFEFPDPKERASSACSGASRTANRC